MRIDRKVLAERLGVAPDRIESSARRITASFQMQRRGVETRIILGAATPQLDPMFAKNILVALRWYAAIKAGTSFGDLAIREKISISLIQQMIGRAFFVPDVVDQIASGRQPVGFTSSGSSDGNCLQHGISSGRSSSDFDPAICDSRATKTKCFNLGPPQQTWTPDCRRQPA